MSLISKAFAPYKVFGRDRWSGYRIRRLRTVSPRFLSLRSPLKHLRARWRFRVKGRFCFRAIGFRAGTRRHSKPSGEKLFDEQRLPTFGFTTSAPRTAQD